MMSEVNRWTIYMYTFPNGKKYIGATTRPLSHRQGSSWQKYKRSTLLYEAIQEFGTENIDQTILFEGFMENRLAHELEAFFIEVYKTNANRYSNPSYGYNQTDGGEGTTAKTITEERREQLRAQMDAFHKAKLGTHPTEETRRRQSEAHIGEPMGLMPLEQRRKIGRAQTKKEKARPRKSKHGPKRAVISHNPATGETLRFESFSEAGFYYGVNSGSVSRWVANTRRPPEGLIFIKEESLPPDCNWNICHVDIDSESIGGESA